MFWKFEIISNYHPINFHLRGNYKVHTFYCWDQFLCMFFAQLSYRESLREIEACLRAMQNKLYHIGIQGKVS
ncbi:MAG: DUF4372 domain-containing protein [bacterium]|nr:MAG: DUF4372 domain-containing protein [bacterium]